MIDWFMGLPGDRQGIVIGAALAVVGLILVIIGAYCQYRAEKHRQLQREQARTFSKMS